MKKKNLFLLLSLMSLCFVALLVVFVNSSKVYADEGTQDETTPEITEVTTEQPTIEVETELTEEEKAKVQELLNKALEGFVVISTGDFNTIKAWGIGVVGVEAFMLLLCLIIIVRLLLKRALHSAAHDKAMSELNATNQKRALETEKAFDEKLDKLQKLVEAKLKKDDEEKATEAEEKAKSVVALLDNALKGIE